VITAFLITLILLATSGLALYFWQRAGRDNNIDKLAPPPGVRGLFPDQYAESEPAASAKEEAARRRERLLERAALADPSALDEAHRAGDRDLYNEVLDELTRQAETSHERLRALVAHITESKTLRSNARLAQMLIESFKHNPDRRAIADMLHIAALADDAAIYEQAVEEAVEFWRRGQPSELTAENLLALVESQYWVLSPEARRSGAGFALRQSLERCRRQLVQAARAR
jgi:hypothetical protein